MFAPAGASVAIAYDERPFFRNRDDRDSWLVVTYPSGREKHFFSMGELRSHVAAMQRFAALFDVSILN